MNRQIIFPLQRILNWDKWHICLIFIGCICSLYYHEFWILGVLSLVSYTRYIYIFRKELNQYAPFAGYANWVTIFRVVLLISICLLQPFLNYWLQYSLFLVCICLDWLDGYLAKKLDLKSDFGLYIDMETDALLIAMMTIVLWEKYSIHWVVLLAGMLRYIYAFLLLLINSGDRKEPKRNYASYVAGFFYVSLLLFFITDAMFNIMLLYTSSVSIILSFARSFYFQMTGK